MLPDEQCTIGNITLKNRIVMAPMISNLADFWGNTNENHSAYLVERAAGDVGLIISEYTYINDRDSKGSLNELGFYDRDFIPKLRRLTERVHNHGTKIFSQLVHTGGKALTYGGKVEPVAPSAVEYPGRIPKELTVSEIGDIIEDFVRASRLSYDSKFDGIEIHGAHGYLVQEFISPALNRRNDSYGGSFEKRIRFAQEVVDAVKSEIDNPVGIRLSLYEDDPDGYGPDYGLKVAESLRSIDYVHFSAGRFAPPGSSASFYHDSFHVARRLPRKPNIVTMVAGSIRSASDVREVLKTVDLVSVGRALLADPYFAHKVINDPESIRPCIRCNQACRDLGLGEVRCTVNPDTGLESSRRDLIQLKGEVAVIGGGIKGMEAALTAAKHGLRVNLYEREASLGGQLLTLRDEYKKREFSRLVQYYERVLYRLGVTVETGQEFRGKGIDCSPDRVYRSIEKKDELSIDSNLYQHHDEVLGLAAESKILLSDRSLDSLDRARRSKYESELNRLGVKIIPFSEGKFDISIHEKNQYDILAAMISGRNAVEKHLRRELNSFL